MVINQKYFHIIKDIFETNQKQLLQQNTFVLNVFPYLRDKVNNVDVKRWYLNDFQRLVFQYHEYIKR